MKPTKITVTIDDLRAIAADIFYAALGKAPVLVTKYTDKGAFAYCEWQDGVREYMSVDYQELMDEGQHDRAMRYIEMYDM